MKFLPLKSKKILGKSSDVISNWLDLFTNFILCLVIILILKNTISWFFTLAEWDVIVNNLDLYIYGSYPSTEKWRPLVWIFLLGLISLLSLKKSYPRSLKKILPSLWLSLIPLGIILISGGLGLEEVQSNNWGGLTLTLLLTITSASISFPLGVILALGRQSDLLLIRWICRLYIDLMRSVPLIAVLFFGQLLIPLFLPIEIEINRVLRAVMAFSAFASSYIAEDLRGGIQAIPKTQQEAAKVIGLSSRQIFLLVILPQAFKTSLPALTNQLIGLLQNTSLMAILGLVELLGISQSILANPEFIGRYLEMYVWLAAIYWFLCTWIALLSRNIEKQLNH